MSKFAHQGNRRQASGFTLIELLVVVSIIALLVSILLPALSSAREQAKRVVCASNQHQIGIGILLYAEDNVGLVPPCNISSQYMPYLVYDSQWQQKYNLGRLYTKYVPNQEMYYCPSAKNRYHSFNTLDNPWWDLWDPAELAQGVQNGTMSIYTRSSYYYFTRENHFQDGNWANTNGGWEIKKKSEKLTNQAIVCDNMYNPIDYPHAPKGSSASSGGLNVMFIDASVRFWRDDTAYLKQIAETWTGDLTVDQVYTLFAMFDMSY